MISRTAIIGADCIVVKSADHTMLQMDWLIGFLEKFYKKNKLPGDGETIQFGWTILTVKRLGNELLVYAPDFDRDPSRDITEDLTVSLEIQASQNDILHKLGLEGQAVNFQDKVITTKGVLTERRVYLERKPNTPKWDSGWFVGSVEKRIATPELEAFYVYQFLKIRRSMLSVFSLPAGFLVVFDGDSIDAVLDKNDVDLWCHSQGASRPLS